MNIALVFAGGIGLRMNTKSRPKQFLELHGKPIIVYTLEIFQTHPDIDAIVVSCVEEWIPYMSDLKEKYHLDKIVNIVQGGTTGHVSIFNGLKEISSHYGSDSVVLIHDAVRPLIDHEFIDNNIRSVKLYGSSVTVACATDTAIVVNAKDSIEKVQDRAVSMIAKAPQSFYLKDILAAHEQALDDGLFSFIDSCSLMHHYGHELHIVHSSHLNIKITNPVDFYLFRAIEDAKENCQIVNL